MSGLNTWPAGKACLYINKLEDVDMGVLVEPVSKSVAWMKMKYGA